MPVIDLSNLEAVLAALDAAEQPECCGECEGYCPLRLAPIDLDLANDRAEAFREDAQAFEDIATRLYAQALERELWFIRDGDNVFTAVKGVEPEDARLFLANIVSAYLAT